jgi:hypothetical protein
MAAMIWLLGAGTRMGAQAVDFHDLVLTLAQSLSLRGPKVLSPALALADVRSVCSPPERSRGLHVGEHVRGHRRRMSH